MPFRHLLLCLLVPLCAAACSGGGTAPAVSFSIQLADGRTCRDADITDVILTTPTMPEHFVCADAVAPGMVTAVDLPLSDSVPIVATSNEGAHLYSGSLVAEDALAGPMPALVILYPDQVR